MIARYKRVMNQLEKGDFYDRTAISEKKSNQLAEMLHKELSPQIETILAKGGNTQDNIGECNEVFDDLVVLLR